MNSENLLIHSADEITPKSLITIVEKDGGQNGLWVLEKDPKNKNKFYGLYSGYLLHFPCMATCNTIQMKAFIFDDNDGRKFYHTTADVRKERKDCLVREMDEYIKDHPGRFILSNKLVREFITSL